VAQFRQDLAAPVFVAMHIPPYSPSLLPEILSRSGPLAAVHPRDSIQVEPGIIYVAPPDHHLLIDDGIVAVKKGPKENGFRPSIDALFRSAAYSYGPAAIGVVLSGSLDDGTSGLWSIKRLGGTAIVQDPAQAEYQSMPRSALEYIEADYKLPSDEIGLLLGRMVNEQSIPEAHSLQNKDGDMETDIRQMAKELQIAAGIGVSEQSILDLGPISPFTCPECHGVLVRITEGKFTRFRCHTGHGYSQDALLQSLTQQTGELIWQVTRGLQETAMLLSHIGRHLRDGGETQAAEKFFAKSRELDRRASTFQAEALAHQSLSGNNLNPVRDQAE
jgi:two-component system chemotaxis response regulator CheB